MDTVKDTTTATRKNSLVDLHCHILPGIDDGSKSLEDSLTLARKAVSEGIGYIVATPHHLDRHFTNHAPAVRQAVADFQTQLDQAKIPLTIFPGQEVHLNGDLAQRLPDLLGLDANMNYLLVEFPHEEVPAYAEQLFFELSCQNITPVIAHPERNARIKKDPQVLFNFISEGALAQLTATSLVGGFGRKTKKFSEELVENGLVQIISSDAHMLKGREFALREAYFALDDLNRDYGPIFYQNSRHIINGEPFQHAIPAEPVTKHHLFR